MWRVNQLTYIGHDRAFLYAFIFSNLFSMFFNLPILACAVPCHAQCTQQSTKWIEKFDLKNQKKSLRLDFSPDFIMNYKYWAFWHLLTSLIELVKINFRERESMHACINKLQTEHKKSALIIENWINGYQSAYIKFVWQQMNALSSHSFWFTHTE